MDVRQMPLDEIARRCEEETDKFRHKQAADNQFCFELFRRALEEQVQEAFSHVFRAYHAQCARWVRDVPGFEETGELSPDAFVSQAFASFYRDLKGDRFGRFTSLQAVLKYLKKCVITAVLQQLRKPSTLELPVDIAEDLKTEIEYEQLWGRICYLLPEEPDRLLADLHFRQNFKPIEIARMHPDHWATAREVSVALQRIRRALRRDRELRIMAGIPPEDDRFLDSL